MILSQSARSRWLLCFSLAVFQVLEGLAIASLAVVQMALAKYFHAETPHVDTCHDSTVAAVLQGNTLLIAGSVGISAYGSLIKQGSVAVPRLVLVVIYVLFSAIIAFVGYSAAASHGCFALGRGGEKQIFGLVVARVVLSYLCHIVGGLSAGFAVPDLCVGIMKVGKQQDNRALHEVVQRMNSQTVSTPNKELIVITLPESDGSTIYSVPQDQFVVQKREGDISVPAAATERIEHSEKVRLTTET